MRKHKRIIAFLLSLILIISSVDLTNVMAVNAQTEDSEVQENVKEYIVCEDAFIRSDRGTTNFDYENITSAHGEQYVGKDYKVINAKNANMSIITMMKFELPSSEDIEKYGLNQFEIEFNIFKNLEPDLSNQIYHFYYTLDTDWSETSVTWNTKPESVKVDGDNLLFDFEIEKGNAYEFKTDTEKCISVDITNKIAELVKQNVEKITIFVTAENKVNTGLMIHSKESVSGKYAAKIEGYSKDITKEDLYAAIEKASQMDQSEYTDSSYLVLAEALEKAKTIYDDENATGLEINCAIKNLQDAMEQLKSEENVALNKTVYYSDLNKTTGKAAVDGTTTSHWSGGSHNSWFYVDLGAVYETKRVNVITYADQTRYYNYEVYGSIDCDNWVKIGEKNDEIPDVWEGKSFDTDGGQYRFVKVQFSYNSANIAVHLSELEVFGKEASEQPNFIDVHDMLEKVYDDGDNSMPYRLYVPEDYESTKEYPVIVFLHGAGERGTGNTAQLTNAIQNLFDTQKQVKESIVIAPQCPTGKRWVETDWTKGNYDSSSIQEEQLATVMKILKEIQANYTTDQDRIYAIGLSMGGIATWNLLMNHSDVFAAGIPICGAADVNKANILKNIPIWTFHGTADPTVPYSATQQMVQAIQSAGGDKITFTSYSGMEHAIWNNAVGTPGLIDWLFEQKLSDRDTGEETPDLPSTDKAKEYTVTEDAYIRSDRATSNFDYENITSAHGEQYVGKNYKVINAKTDGRNIVALMKFNLPTLEEIETSKIDTVDFVFHIFKNADPNTGDQTYHFYYTTDTEWSENTVTWNTKPESVKVNGENLLFDFDIKQGDAYEYKTDEEKCISVDVTKTIAELAEQGITEITIYMVAANAMNTSLLIHSKESADGSYASKLVAYAETVTKEDLQEKIKEAEAVDQEIYTEESYQLLLDALDKAKSVYEDSSATGLEIKSAMLSLQEAIDGLEINADPVDSKNIAYGKPTRSNLDKNNTDNVTDGNLSTSWQGKFFPSYIDVDLMDTYAIEDIELYFPAGKAFYYTVYGSNDGKDYTQIFQSRSDEKKTSQADVITLEGECNYRILRVYVEYNDTDAKSILSEIKVHGSKTETNTSDLRTGSFEEITGIQAFDETEYADEITTEETIENVYGIIDRTVGAEYREWFSFEIAENAKNDNDYFELSTKDGKVHIKGNEGLSLATGLNYYYKNHVNVQISEQTMQTDMPEKIVLVPETVYKETEMKVRYAYNYCT